MAEEETTSPSWTRGSSRMTSLVRVRHMPPEQVGIPAGRLAEAMVMAQEEAAPLDPSLSTSSMKASASRPARSASKARGMTSTGQRPEQGQLFGRRGQQGLGLPGAEKMPRMRLEGDQDRVPAGFPAFGHQGVQDARMAQMDAVEIAQGGHGRTLPGSHRARTRVAGLRSWPTSTLRGQRLPSASSAAMASRRPFGIEDLQRGPFRGGPRRRSPLPRRPAGGIGPWRWISRPAGRPRDGPGGWRRADGPRPLPAAAGIWAAGSDGVDGRSPEAATGSRRAAAAAASRPRERRPPPGRGRWRCGGYRRRRRRSRWPVPGRGPGSGHRCPWSRSCAGWPRRPRSRAAPGTCTSTSRDSRATVSPARARA